MLCSTADKSWYSGLAKTRTKHLLTAPTVFYCTAINLLSQNAQYDIQENYGAVTVLQSSHTQQVHQNNLSIPTAMDGEI